MAEIQRPTQQQQPITERIKGFLPEKGPSAAQVIAVATLLPAGGILLGISGITLVGTIIGLCVSTPVFVIFSPVIAPASIAIGLAVAGFLFSGALGVAGLSAFSWLHCYMRGSAGVPPPVEPAKRRVPESAGQRPREVGQRAGAPEGGRIPTEGGRV